jgi:hypothetical protein
VVVLNKVVYHNMTQAFGPRLCYFRSTDVEQKNYHRLLWSVTDEMLYLALIKGKKIVVIDRSTKRQNKIHRVFLPVLESLLNDTRPKHLASSHQQALSALERDRSLKTRFEFWRKRARHKAAFKGRTIRVKREVANDPAPFIKNVLLSSIELPYKAAKVPQPDGSGTP